MNSLREIIESSPSVRHLASNVAVASYEPQALGPARWEWSEVRRVLVVQNRARRTYTEEEEEALQTTAMVLAEMIASGELSSLARPGAEPAARHSMHFIGTSLSDGIALGHVVLHEPRVVITSVIADDVQHELKRLDAAIATLRADLDRLVEHRDVADGGEHRDVLEAYRMFSYDQGWLHRIREAVMTGLTAEASVERVQSDTRARMLRASDQRCRSPRHQMSTGSGPVRTSA